MQQQLFRLGNDAIFEYSHDSIICRRWQIYIFNIPNEIDIRKPRLPTLAYHYETTKYEHYSLFFIITTFGRRVRRRNMLIKLWQSDDGISLFLNMCEVCDFILRFWNWQLTFSNTFSRSENIWQMALTCIRISENNMLTPVKSKLYA